jgi:hypothetical protein
MPGSIGGLRVVAEVVAVADVDGACVDGRALDVARDWGPGSPAQAVATANVTNAAEASQNLLTRRAPRPMSA